MKMESLASYDEYVKNGDLSATDFTGSVWQLRLKLDKVERLNFGGTVQAMVGTGIHKLAEIFYAKQCNLAVEQRACRELMGMMISGTVDILEFNGTNWTIRDHKTKGAYSAKKFLNGDTEKENIQLSINRWIREKMFQIGDTGYIHVYVMGDIPRNDKPLLEKRDFEVPLTLKDLDQTEAFMTDMIKEAKLAIKPDCEDWQCGYCSLSCPYRKAF
jgi:hypothetical protein